MQVWALRFNAMQPEWWGSECDDTQRAKYAALRQFRVTNSAIHLRNFKDLRNEFKAFCKNKLLDFQRRERKDQVLKKIV